MKDIKKLDNVCQNCYTLADFSGDLAANAQKFKRYKAA